MGSAVKGRTISERGLDPLLSRRRVERAEALPTQPVRHVHPELLAGDVKWPAVDTSVQRAKGVLLRVAVSTTKPLPPLNRTPILTRAPRHSARKRPSLAAHTSTLGVESRVPYRRSREHAGTYRRNPIARRDFAGGAIISRSASNTTRNCASYFFSSVANLRAKSVNMKSTGKRDGLRFTA